MLYQRGKAYSQDLRDRVFAVSDDGGRVGEVAGLLRVSVSYVSKALTRRRTTGETTARPRRGRPTPKLVPFYGAIRAHVEACGSTTIEEARAWLLATHQVSASVVWRTPKLLGPPRPQAVSAYDTCQSAPTYPACGHSPGQEFQCPAPAAGRRPGAGGGHQQRLLFVRQFAFGTGTWHLAEGSFHVAEHEPALGAIHRREADRDVVGDSLIAFAGVGGKQDLCPLQLAGGVDAAAEHLVEVVALLLVQFHPQHTFIVVPLRTEDADKNPMSGDSRPGFYRASGAIPGLHPCLHLGDRPPARRERHATFLPGQRIGGAPDDGGVG